MDTGHAPPFRKTFHWPMQVIDAVVISFKKRARWRPPGAQE
jgi:hypothetical protein